MNPFDDSDASYFVLINDEGQHSLWPVFAEVPEGWQVIFGEAGRRECLDFIEESWTDMRPKSLIAAMEGYGSEREPPSKKSMMAELTLSGSSRYP
jgi:uncharacterized protein YbdZ (MbtH family)